MPNYFPERIIFEVWCDVNWVYNPRSSGSPCTDTTEPALCFAGKSHIPEANKMGKIRIKLKKNFFSFSWLYLTMLRADSW